MLPAKSTRDADDRGARFKSPNGPILQFGQTKWRRFLDEVRCGTHDLSWRKSSRSGSNGNQCIEVARTPSRSIATRDSKSPKGPFLRFGQREWRRFLAEVRHGAYDI